MKGIPFRFLANIDLKSVDFEKREIQGFASTVDIDRDEEIYPAVAFRESIDQFMKVGTLLYEHGQDSEYQRRPIGKVIDYSIQDNGLWIKARVSDDWVWDKISKGELSAFSWGGRVLNFEKRMIEGIERFVALAIDLFEVSVVSVPANPNALFSIAKSIDNALLEYKDNDMDKIQEMVKSLQEKFDTFSERDEKIKSLKEEKKSLKAELAEKSAKIEELEKQIAEKAGLEQEIEEKIKSLDEKLEQIIGTKKKAVSDEKAEEEVKVEEVEVSAEEVEKKLKQLINL